MLRLVKRCLDDQFHEKIPRQEQSVQGGKPILLTTLTVHQNREITLIHISINFGSHPSLHMFDSYGETE